MQAANAPCKKSAARLAARVQDLLLPRLVVLTHLLQPACLQSAALDASLPHPPDVPAELEYRANHHPLDCPQICMHTCMQAFKKDQYAHASKLKFMSDNSARLSSVHASVNRRASRLLLMWLHVNVNSRYEGMKGGGRADRRHASLCRCAVPTSLAELISNICYSDVVNTAM